MDGETDFRDDGNVEALAGQGSDFSNKDQEQDVETLYNEENSFSTKDQEIGVDSDEAIQATVGYGSLSFIVLNL